MTHEHKLGALASSCLKTAFTLLITSLLALCAHASCSSSTLAGNTYRFLAKGIGCTTNAQQPHPCPVFPLASVGMITFNADGTVVGSDIHNVTGLSCSRTFTGSYTVNSNCTGTLTQVYATPTCGPSSSVGDIVVAPEGSDILMMLPDNAEVLTAEFRKQ